MGKYNEVPLYISVAAKNVYNQIRVYVSENSDYLTITKDSNFQMEVRGVGDNSIYYFQVGKPEKDTGNRISLPVAFAPTSTVKLTRFSRNYLIPEMLTKLKDWNDLIIKLDTITIHPDDEIDKQYQEEFNDWFDIIDEDSETKAFDATQQILIDNIIERTIPLLLKEGFKDDEEPIVKALWLKNNVATLTKKQVIKTVREIYAPIRKRGIKLVVKIYKVVEAETISMGYRLLTENLGEAFLRLL
jgi:hypothetical protein